MENTIVNKKKKSLFLVYIIFSIILFLYIISFFIFNTFGRFNDFIFEVAIYYLNLTWIISLSLVLLIMSIVALFKKNEKRYFMICIYGINILFFIFSFYFPEFIDKREEIMKGDIDIILNKINMSSDIKNIYLYNDLVQLDNLFIDSDYSEDSYIVTYKDDVEYCFIKDNLYYKKDDDDIFVGDSTFFDPGCSKYDVLSDDYVEEIVTTTYDVEIEDIVYKKRYNGFSEVLIDKNPRFIVESEEGLFFNCELSIEDYNIILVDNYMEISELYNKNNALISLLENSIFNYEGINSNVIEFTQEFREDTYMIIGESYLSYTEIVEVLNYLGNQLVDNNFEIEVFIESRNYPIILNVNNGIVSVDY